MIKKRLTLVALVASLWGCSETINIYHEADASVTVDTKKNKKSGSDGKVEFWDELESDEAKITIVDDDTGKPVTDAKVSFTNNGKFKLYTVDHPSYTHMSFLRQHNSSHVFRLQQKPIVFQKHNGYTNEDSLAAAQALRNMWVPQGCITAEDAKTNKERASYFIWVANKVAKPVMVVINKMYTAQEKLQDLLIGSGFVEGGDCKAFRVYTSNTSAPVGRLLFKECLDYVPDDCGPVKASGTVSIKGDIWQRNAPGAKFTWNEANNYCSSSTLAGKSWGMPTQEELLSIRNKNGTCKMPDSLEGKCGKYWTNNGLCFGSTDNATTVVFDSTGSTSCQEKNSEHYVRCIEK